MNENTKYTIDIETRDNKIVDMSITKGIYDRCEFVADGINEPVGASWLARAVREYFVDEGIWIGL